MLEERKKIVLHEARRAEELGLCRHRSGNFSLRDKESGLICWQNSAAEIDRKIRAYTPWPGAFTRWNGTKLALLQAHPYTGDAVAAQPDSIGLVLGTDRQQGILIQTGQGILAVRILQRESKKAMQWKDFLNGTPELIGQTFV